MSAEDYVDELRIEAPTRACDACRKMKIKCIDKENPPCKRCRHMKLPCRFAMAPVPRVVLEEQEATKGRLEDLEGQVSGIYRKLDDMSNMLLHLAGKGTLSPPSIPSVPSLTEAPSVAMSLSPRAVMRASRDGTLGAPTPRPASVVPTVDGSFMQRPEYPLDSGTSSTLSGEELLRSHGGSSDFAAPPLPHHMGPFASAVVMPHPHRPPPQPKLSGSDEDADDILVSAMANEPFRHFTQRPATLRMTSHDIEAAAGGAAAPAGPRAPGSVVSEPAQEHSPSNDPANAGSVSVNGSTTEKKRSQSRPPRGLDPSKRLKAHRGSYSHGLENEFELGDELDSSSAVRDKSDALKHSPDPVSMGYISEEEGKRLFDAFFKYAHPFTPVFDPREDTWDKLRKRSPFCITIIILIAVRQRDKAGQPSELSKALQEHAEQMSKMTLFSPMGTLETVQGLGKSLLISYSEHAWRICCHAMALAVDMRLYRCLPYLHKIRTSPKPHHMLERQRPLVVGARLWLALLRLAYEISYNHALPILFPSHPGSKRTQYARELLDHPLSALYDSRLVVSVEMCEVREAAFQPYDCGPGQNTQEMDVLLSKANHGIRELYDFWFTYYERLGLPPDHFLRVELDHQKAYAIMFTNPPAWYGVRTRADVEHLSPDRKEWVSSAMRSAAFLVSSVANKRLEADSEFGNNNFHIGILATARYLIRMAELLPSVCNLHEISLDIDRLLLKLPYYPVGPFIDGLRRTVGKARAEGVLPYTPMSEAALRPNVSVSTPPPPLDASFLYPGFNPFPWNDPIQAVRPPAAGSGSGSLPISSDVVSALVDTGLVGELDPATGLGSLSQPLPPGDLPWPEDLNLAMWFPGLDDATHTHTDTSVLDADMANWFPAAPQVWLEDDR